MLWIAAHGVAYAPCCSPTSRTARSRTSGAKGLADGHDDLDGLALLMAPNLTRLRVSSKTRGDSGRFTHTRLSLDNRMVSGSVCPDGVETTLRRD